MKLKETQMIRTNLGCALLAACLGAPACTLNISNPTNFTQITTVTMALSAPASSAIAGCPAIAKIRVSYPETLAKGSKAPISATPLDPEGKPREPRCDLGDGISWSVSPSDLLSISDRKAFDTEVTAGSKAGSAKLSVDVGQAGSSFTVTVL